MNGKTTPTINPLAGKPALASMLVDIPKLVTAYYEQIPDPHVPGQQVLFGTSGHRGSSFENSFNQWHILAITQAICLYRTEHNTLGPLFIGFDTHALSAPAFASALEVLAANKVNVMIALNDEYTPTPVISHAILTYNCGRTAGFADGIVITPSHNPPRDGGFKYNPSSGGPANEKITQWIEKKANALLKNKLKDVKRMAFAQALKASTTHRFDYLNQYVNSLNDVIDMSIISDTNIHLGVDPLGGAGVHYWPTIAERYKLNLTVINETIDPTFRFMTVDWDGQIRMDPSSPYAMRRLIDFKDRFDIAVACDTDSDRHGIVTRDSGLMPPNHYLATAIFYLFELREGWSQSAAIGKTIVSSQMIDKVAAKLSRRLYEVPVGFKWFVDGLLNSTLGFAGEESAGASFSRKNGATWTTDKDGIIPALLAAEMTARMQRDPSKIYQELEEELGVSHYRRIDAQASTAQKKLLATLSSEQIHETQLAGDPIQSIITKAPGNEALIGGVKVSTANGWFAARPSGTESIYKIYAESFQSSNHLQQIIQEAQDIVDTTLGISKTGKEK
jgi:phosphoglucomutase